MSRLADRLGTPYVVATAMLFEMLLHHELRDVERVAETAQRFMGHSAEQGYPFFQALAGIGQGWCRAHEGDGEEGIQQIRAGIAGFRATGARLPVSYYLHFLADARIKASKP